MTRWVLFPNTGFVCLLRTLAFRVIDCGSNVIAIFLVHFSMYIALIYRPPISSMEDNAKFNDFLIDFCIDKEILLMGDLPPKNYLVTTSVSD